jgi:hypothetical protein
VPGRSSATLGRLSTSVAPISPSFLAVLFGWAQAFLAPLLALGISAVYFFTSPSTQSLAKRLLASAHGASIAALYVVAIFISWTHRSSQNLGSIFLPLLAVPLLLIGLSVYLYRGRKAVHLLQIPNLLCLGWTYFVGGMAVTGNWV